jgi:hypothetical protein
MPTGPGKTKTSIEIESELWIEAQIAAIRRRRNVRTMVEESLRLWMQAGEVAGEVVIPAHHPVTHATPEELEVAAAAIALLREGNQTATEILDTMLRRYKGKLALKAGKESRRRA